MWCRRLQSHVLSPHATEDVWLRSCLGALLWPLISRSSNWRLIWAWSRTIVCTWVSMLLLSVRRFPIASKVLTKGRMWARWSRCSAMMRCCASRVRKTIVFPMRKSDISLSPDAFKTKRAALRASLCTSSKAERCTNLCCFTKSAKGRLKRMQFQKYSEVTFPSQ